MASVPRLDRKWDEADLAELQGELERSDLHNQTSSEPMPEYDPALVEVQAGHFVDLGRTQSG